MKTQRMSLASIKNVLSRDEMRRIMAGSAGCNGQECGNVACPGACQCSGSYPGAPPVCIN